MATLKDVAERVGVSITTVSRVLNNRGSISQKTKDEVFKAMKELDYFPNEMARSLSTKNSHVIGLIVPYIDAEDLFGKDLESDVRRAIKQFPKTDGIFATSDVLAARIINAQLGLGRNSYMAVVGFDGVDISDYCAISTVAQPIRQMGELAVDLLIKRINGHMIRQMRVLSLTEPIPA